MSVMRVSFHINNRYIGDIIGLSMKIILALIICSQTQQICMPPHSNGLKLFNSQYDCA